MKPTILFSAVLMMSLASAEGWADPGVVRFVVTTQNDKGRVRCALYNHKKKWLGEEMAHGSIVSIKNGEAICVFEDVTPGHYAFSAFHDEDEDGELDTNFLGIPTEDYCASNDARSSVGPPDYNKALFKFSGGTLERKLAAK